MSLEDKDNRDAVLAAFERHLDNLHLEAEEKKFKAIKVQAELINIFNLYSGVLGFTLKDIQAYYHQRAAPTLDTIRAYTLREILSYKNTDLSGAIVPRIITVGVNILIAEAKKGKSRFLYFLLKSLIATKEFLGFPTREVQRILYYQLEEGTPTVKKRLINSQLDDIENPNVLQALETDQVIILRSLDLSAGIDPIKLDVREFSQDGRKIDLIFIDTLRAAMANSTISENSADWAIPVAQLQAYGNLHNISIIILHHTNKKGEGAGTSALYGHANQLLKLVSNDNPEFSKQALVLETKPREGLPNKFTIQGRREGTTENLVLLKEEGVTSEILSLEVRIINLLKQDEYRQSVCFGLTIEDIANHLDLEEDSTQSIILTLERLQESCFIDSNRTKGKDYFYIPDYILENYGSLGVLGKANILEVKHQDISVLLQTATTKEDVSEAFSGLSEVDKDTVWGLLSSNHKNRIKSILLQTAFSKKEILKIFKKDVSNEDREAIVTLLPEEHQSRIRAVLAS